MDTYTLQICGLQRNLPIVPISKNISIASFVLLGDVELIERCAYALWKKIALKSFQLNKEIDLLVTPEAKSLPLVHSLARLMDLNYIVIRKSVKGYMVNPLIEKAKSITTTNEQTLVLDSCDTTKLKNKNVVIVDDVVSTGGSFLATKNLLNKVGVKEIVAEAAILKEDAGYENENLIYLEDLPIFRK